MTLQKKIISSFLISAFVIAAFVITALLSLFEIRSEIRYLELSDSIRTKSLQLRRHEKNYFLYREQKEIDAVAQYLGEIKGLVAEGKKFDGKEGLLLLTAGIDKYEKHFNSIKNEISMIETQLNSLSRRESLPYLPLLNASFIEKPLTSADFISMHAQELKPIVPRLLMLETEIAELRKIGEEIIGVSRQIDKSARLKVERAITIAEVSALVVLPLFLVGIYGLFVIGRSVVKRLKILTQAAESTGKGDFSTLKIPFKDDEVGHLISAFNKMEGDLKDRDEEIKKKNEELFQSRKLASIGTLASGVAHELNNPLNNIYLSAQVLLKEVPDGSPSIVQETIEEIYSETLRVKRIVGDLLEFSRGKQPDKAPVDLAELLREVIHQKEPLCIRQNIRFISELPTEAFIPADRHMMEQVFINLIDNAIDAMKETGGALSVSATETNDSVEVKIADTGKGISPLNLRKIYDPFFTTKAKGTGLGLSIVYGIIEKHGGTIKAESVEGKGTSFNLTLPKER